MPRNMKCNLCNEYAVSNQLCRRHFNKSVQIAIKMIEFVQKKEKGYKPMRVKETFGIFG